MSWSTDLDDLDHTTCVSTQRLERIQWFSCSHEKRGSEKQVQLVQCSPKHSERPTSAKDFESSYATRRLFVSSSSSSTKETEPVGATALLWSDSQRREPLTRLPPPKIRKRSQQANIWRHLYWTDQHHECSYRSLVWNGLRCRRLEHQPRVQVHFYCQRRWSSRLSLGNDTIFLHLVWS